MKQERTETFKAKAFKIGKWIESASRTEIKWESDWIDSNDLSGLIDDYMGTLHNPEDFWLNGTPFLLKEEGGTGLFELNSFHLFGGWFVPAVLKNGDVVMLAVHLYGEENLIEATEP
jgi:hypothetical protein